MNKKQFINEVATRNGITPRHAERVINDVMDALRVILSRGEEVEVGGLGTFGILVDLRGERIPVFKGGKALRKVLNVNQND